MRATSLITTSALCGLITASIAGVTQAAVITAVDFDSLDLGATIVGPVGPTVEVTFTDSQGDGIGDLISRVVCPAGVDPCAPPTNPAGTIYTYVHEVTPGVDFPNDAPFPAPGTVLPFDGADQFALAFRAEGFNGVAGLSFSDAQAVLNPGASASIESQADGSLIWLLSADAGWDTGETLRFFWQTTQPPSGPGGLYALGSDQNGTAAGPLPTAVPEPAAWALLALGLGLLLRRRQT